MGRGCAARSTSADTDLFAVSLPAAKPRPDFALTTTGGAPFRFKEATAGRLTLAGAPTPLVQAAHEEVLALILTCVESQRRGHYEYWKDSMSGTRPDQLDDAPKPRRKRKKKEPPPAAPPVTEG